MGDLVGVLAFEFGGRGEAGVLAGVLKKKSVMFFWGVLGGAGASTSGRVTAKDFTTSSRTCHDVTFKMK